MHELPLSILFALHHWLLLALLQFENLLMHRRLGSRRRFLLLPMVQTENILAATLVCAFAGLLDAGSLARLAFFVGYAILTAYVVVDQVYYKRFLDHFRPSSMRGIGRVNPWLMSKSVRSELDWVFRANAIFSACGIFWLASLPGQTFHCNLADSFARCPKIFWLAIGVLALVGLPAACFGKLRQLQRHPLTVLFQDLWQSRLTYLHTLSASWKPSETATLVEPESAPAVDDRVFAAAEEIRGKSRKPNVILIVLESVGATQLLSAEGAPCPQTTPHLAALSRKALIFNTVYSAYPCTIRTYVPLETGGVVATMEPDWEKQCDRFEALSTARHFSAHGYRTAFFSSMSLQQDSMKDWILSMGYDKLYDFQRSGNRRNMVHGWGGVEESTQAPLARWILEGPNANLPFYLTYWTCATHHPYGAPPHYAAPFAGDDLMTRYRNALHYTDAAIQNLLEFLRERSLLESTTVLLTGDHGEAFGTLHPSNYFHSNFLYEENVHSFLMVLNPSLAESVVSSRPGQCGDIFPTIADLAGLALPEVSGKTLCSREFPSRFVFFFTLSGIERWGLRDGKWKFIQAIRDRSAELYDLSTDPTEQTNLAVQHRDRVAGYERRCREWFTAANEGFRAKLLKRRRDQMAA